MIYSLKERRQRQLKIIIIVLIFALSLVYIYINLPKFQYLKDFETNIEITNGIKVSPNQTNENDLIQQTQKNIGIEKLPVNIETDVTSVPVDTTNNDSDITSELPVNTEEPIVTTDGTGTVTGSVTDVTTEVTTTAPTIISPPFIEPSESMSNDYFKDALFMGDSRMQGFFISGQIKATYFVYKGLTISDYSKKAVFNVASSEVPVTIFDALVQNPNLYKKIYVSFGTNEIGWSSDRVFYITYKNVIKSIKEICPDAIIYLVSIYPVSELAEPVGKSAQDANIQIRKYNEHLKNIATEENVYYLETYDLYANEDGYMYNEYSQDGIHLYNKYYKMLAERIRTHTIKN